MKYERRVSLVIECRAADGELPKIVGYAALFNSLSEDLGGFREQIAPGAFSSIETDDIRALFNHQPEYVLGRNTAGTLGLAEDAKGLRVEITPPDTAWANDLISSMRRGDINQMSFGFFTRSDVWDSVNGEIIRTLTDVELFDVSVVTFPAYSETYVDVRALDKAKSIAELPEIEQQAGERSRKLKMIETKPLMDSV